MLIREAIRQEKLPLKIFAVSDGEQAIEFIERAEADPDAPCPDLMLLDLNLPKQDGLEVLRRVRASRRCRDIPVLVITSSDAPSDRSQAAALGAGYFRKPPSYLEFLKLGSAVRQLMEEKGAR